MKYDLKELKKKYDGKSIVEFVTETKNLNEDMIKQGEELIGRLWYLEKTKRFREYDGYQKLNFKVFVDEICNIPFNRYKQLQWAYNWYPQESRELGPQTVQKIRQKVGNIKVPKVLKEIKSSLGKIDKPEKRREVIHDIIEKHVPKQVKNVSLDTKAYWKQKYDDLWEKYQTLLKEYNEVSEQLARQKPTLENYMKVRELVQVPMQ